MQINNEQIEKAKVYIADKYNVDFEANAVRRNGKVVSFAEIAADYAAYITQEKDQKIMDLDEVCEYLDSKIHDLL